MKYENIKSSTSDGVGVITLHRPNALNALSDDLMHELTNELTELESNSDIGAIIITGSDKAFAAGADIKGMVDRSYMDVFLDEFIGHDWHSITNCRKPIIAAVAGYALGGGCELAMKCDFIIAAETAQFGQPEIGLGIIPGAGGTQRLTRFVGKSKAMEMCLTGRTMDAHEAERSGLVSRVVPATQLLDEAVKTAAKIASMSRPSTYMAKAAVIQAYETTLAEGIISERALFLSLFATDDQREGMDAFIEKRSPNWRHK